MSRGIRTEVVYPIGAQAERVGKSQNSSFFFSFFFLGGWVGGRGEGYVLDENIGMAAQRKMGR